MRRAPLVLATLGAWWAGGPGPVAAHTCASPVAVEVGERATVPVGVAAEGAGVTGIDVAVPAGFRLTHVRPPAGWTSATHGGVVELRGGTVAPFGCANFTVEGTATRRGELTFRITTSAADGTTTESSQAVFAGTRSSLGETRFPLGTVVGVGLVGLGAAGGAAAFLRRRRVRRDGGQ